MKKALIKTLFFVSIFFFANCSINNKKYQFLKGQVFGTYYSITYCDKNNIDYKAEIEELFQKFDNSLSTYNPNSIISAINRNDTSVKADTFFNTMFEVAEEVWSQTNGAFDITVAPIVNAWGFGFEEKKNQQPQSESLLSYVGFNKISLKNNKLSKSDKKIMLDASAIAKGQSCDIVADFLDKKGCVDYMIEIGGEIMCKGHNHKNQKWRIGIDKPYEDPANTNNEIQQIVSISNVGMATSGNYRQFYYRNGRKYAHTIDPRTGYPTNNNLLSATVIAPNCVTADAYATGFMVLGVDSALQICNKIKEVDCFLIYEDNNKQLLTKQSNGFKKYLLRQ